MAPRGRPRKSPMAKGQMRMDAALDAMRAYGFPEELISASINELLDVYGLDGWPFIEEACYKVLLENILEKVEAEAKGNGDDCGGDITKASTSGHSSRALAPACSDDETMAIELQSNVIFDDASQNTKVLISSDSTNGSECKAGLSHFAGEGSNLKEINIDKDSMMKELRNNSPSVRPEVRTRKPCYGWIGNSGDDELDLVELTPAPLPDKLAKLLCLKNLSKNRKRRWDVRPEDM